VITVITVVTELAEVPKCRSVLGHCGCWDAVVAELAEASGVSVASVDLSWSTSAVSVVVCFFPV
jgi:hypothetical protein